MSTNQLKFTKEHEWLKIDGNIATIGITEYAQNALGDLVYVELPSEGDEVDKGQDFAVIESVKIASEVYSPVSGKIVEVNNILAENPDLIKDSIETGWIVKIEMSDTTQTDDSLNEKQYKEYLASIED